jgi:hypothetical protein
MKETLSTVACSISPFSLELGGIREKLVYLLLRILSSQSFVIQRFATFVFVRGTRHFWMDASVFPAGQHAHPNVDHQPSERVEWNDKEKISVQDSRRKFK